MLVLRGPNGVLKVELGRRETGKLMKLMSDVRA
jgi:hypothetical protein